VPAALLVTVRKPPIDPGWLQYNTEFAKFVAPQVSDRHVAAAMAHEDQNESADDDWAAVAGELAGRVIGKLQQFGALDRAQIDQARADMSWLSDFLGDRVSPPVVTLLGSALRDAARDVR
jgi:hypothetical protein